MKILQGNLTETIYHMPDSKHELSGPLSIKQETVYSPDQVAYISDEIGLHRVSNPDEANFAMSLHRKWNCSNRTSPSNPAAVYTPPNAAEYGFNVYDERTGRSSHVNPTS